VSTAKLFPVNYDIQQDAYNGDTPLRFGCPLVPSTWFHCHSLQAMAPSEKNYMTEPQHRGTSSTNTWMVRSCLRVQIVAQKQAVWTRDCPYCLCLCWRTPSVCIYINALRTSQEIHNVSATKPSRLMLFSETIAAYCENLTKHANTSSRQNSEFDYVTTFATCRNH
jgi:hypothetical protein